MTKKAQEEKILLDMKNAVTCRWQRWLSAGEPESRVLGQLFSYALLGRPVARNQHVRSSVYTFGELESEGIIQLRTVGESFSKPLHQNMQKSWKQHPNPLNALRAGSGCSESV